MKPSECLCTLMRHTSSSEDSRMFSGFRSRWMIPFTWRYYTHTHRVSSVLFCLELVITQIRQWLGLGLGSFGDKMCSRCASYRQIK